MCPISALCGFLFARFGVSEFRGLWLAISAALQVSKSTLLSLSKSARCQPNILGVLGVETQIGTSRRANNSTSRHHVRCEEAR